jgi:Na+/pantothenate symporter
LFDWIISLSIAAIFAALGLHAHSKLGTIREKDQRPHQLPWGLIMVGCVFAIFLVVVHLMNIVGVETGPENSLLGRF